MTMRAWSFWPFGKDLVLVSDCKIFPHCREVSGGLRGCSLKWTVVVQRDFLRSLRLLLPPFMTNEFGKRKIKNLKKTSEAIKYYGSVGVVEVEE